LRDGHLCAYVVAAAGSSRPVTAPAGALVAALREHVARWLPTYMRPSRYAVVDRLPLSSSAKVDRRALPPIAPAELERVPPGNAVEAEVIAVIGEMLARDDLGVTEDFFASGGHSLAAARTVARLRESFACELRLDVIFEHPTARGIAGALRRSWGGDPGDVDRVAEILQEVRSMSSDDVSAALERFV
jgi:acyl carrier protein